MSKLNNAVTVIVALVCCTIGIQLLGDTEGVVNSVVGLVQSIMSSISASMQSLFSFFKSF